MKSSKNNNAFCFNDLIRNAALPESWPYPNPEWMNWLSEEFDKPYLGRLLERVEAASARGPVYPPASSRFSALSGSPDDVRVVIIGQDPYHGKGQAHGLSFSVLPGNKIPPSLQNIYKELENEGFGPAKERNGCLYDWSKQGVLMLNSVLTVEEGKPYSHKGWGWEFFTDAIVEQLNKRKEGLVFILWGREAASKAARVDRNKHLVLTSPHPSPFSAHSGFFGNNHFKMTNDWLIKRGEHPINW